MTQWTKQYENDTGPNDDCFEEWWIVSDGSRSFRCDTSKDADFLLSVLAQTQQDGACKNCADGCSACDARKLTNDLL